MDKNLKKTKTRKNQKKPQKNTRGNMIQYNRIRQDKHRKQSRPKQEVERN
jgi:hypothetical protein